MFFTQGSWQVKKKPKIREKLGLARPHSSKFFFFETSKQHKKHKIKKIIIIRVRAWPTHPIPSFSRIFGIFLTWQNPLTNSVIISDLVDVNIKDYKLMCLIASMSHIPPPPAPQGVQPRANSHCITAIWK